MIFPQIFQNRTQEVLKSSGFLEVEFSTVLTIFEQEFLELDSELELFQGLKNWTDAEAARQGQSFCSYYFIMKFVVL